MPLNLLQCTALQGRQYKVNKNKIQPIKFGKKLVENKTQSKPKLECQFEVLSLLSSFWMNKIFS